MDAPNKSIWQRNLRIILLVFLSFVVLLTYGLYKNNQRLRTEKKLLAAQNDELQSALKALLLNDYSKQKVLKALPVSAKISFKDVSYDVFIVDISRKNLGLHLRNNKGFTYRSFNDLHQQINPEQDLVFAMNAGMYLNDYDAQGLFIANGNKEKEIDLGDSETFLNFYLKPNGIFYVQDDTAGIIKSECFSDLTTGDITLATQSGPLMVFNDTIHPAFRAHSTNLNVRNGVGLINPKIAVFAISNEPVNFYDFATFFRDRMQCNNALYLDGVVSSLYLPELQRYDSGERLGPIFAIFQ